MRSGHLPNQDSCAHDEHHSTRVARHGFRGRSRQLHHGGADWLDGRCLEAVRLPNHHEPALPVPPGHVHLELLALLRCLVAHQSGASLDATGYTGEFVLLHEITFTQDLPVLMLARILDMSSSSSSLPVGSNDKNINGSGDLARRLRQAKNTMVARILYISRQASSLTFTRPHTHFIHI